MTLEELQESANRDLKIDDTDLGYRINKHTNTSQQIPTTLQ